MMRIYEHGTARILGHVCLWLCLWLFGCHSEPSSVCDGQKGGCLTLHINGKGSGNGLAIVSMFKDPTKNGATGFRLAQGSEAITLPAVVQILEPGDVPTSAIKRLSVQLMTSIAPEGWAEATASTDIDWPDGSHSQAEVTLPDEPGPLEAPFAKPAMLAEGFLLPPYVVADFNQDKKPDLAGKLHDEWKMGIAYGAGSDGLQIDASGWPARVPLDLATAADVNRDGFPDLVLGGSRGTNSEFGIEVGIRKSDGSFADAVSTIIAGLRYDNRPLVIADFDNDGKPDLCFASDSTEIECRHGNGDGSFAKSGTQSLTDLSAYSIAVADWNNDHVSDLLIYGFEGVQILLGNDKGEFQKRPPNYALSRVYTYAASSGVIADLNGDGHLDVAMIYANAIYSLLGNGTGELMPSAIHLAATLSQHSLVVADWNGDGKLDLASLISTKEIRISQNDGQGNFLHTTLTIPNSYVQNLIAIDWNQDGRPDLLATGPTQSYVLLNTATPPSPAS